MAKPDVETRRKDFQPVLVLNTLRLFFASRQFCAVQVNVVHGRPTALVIGEDPNMAEFTELSVDGHSGNGFAVRVKLEVDFPLVVGRQCDVKTAASTIFFCAKTISEGALCPSQFFALTCAAVAQPVGVNWCGLVELARHHVGIVHDGVLVLVPLDKKK